MQIKIYAQVSMRKADWNCYVHTYQTVAIYYDERQINNNGKKVSKYKQTASFYYDFFDYFIFYATVLLKQYFK